MGQAGEGAQRRSEGPAWTANAQAYGQYVSAKLGGPSKYGYLTLTPASATAPARLSFITEDNECYFDVAVGELHSLGLADYNATLEFWHSNVRHRVCLMQLGLAQASVLAEFTGHTEAMAWQHMLAPMVGQPPAGMHVKAPMSKGARVALNWGIGCMLSLVIIVVVFIVVIVGSV